MKILSITTSSNICAAAILEDNQIVKEMIINDKHTHSVNLMPMIDELFKESNLTLNDIDLIVCDKGPGSFTGIRIGVASAKAFSDALDIKEIGISSLEALAYNVETEGLICSIIDARHDNVYAGIFEHKGKKYNLKDELCLKNIKELLEELKQHNSEITFVGDGVMTFKEQIIENLPESKFTLKNDISAYNLGLAGLNHYLENKQDDILPLYLRKTQAELQEEKK